MEVESETDSGKCEILELMAEMEFESGLNAGTVIFNVMLEKYVIIHLFAW